MRYELFRSLFETLPDPVRVLDVGGTRSYWRNVLRGEALKFDVTVFNMEVPSEEDESFPTVRGDARDLSRFADSSFDVVFSNSVIEHVGERADQLRMANEVRRVGRYYFVQTPNRRFPIEPHLQFPLFQYLPMPARVALVRHFSLGWARRMPDPVAAKAYVASIRLLTRIELAALFPDGRMVAERYLGLVKSWIVTRDPGGDSRVAPGS